MNAIKDSTPQEIAHSSVHPSVIKVKVQSEVEHWTRAALLLDFLTN